MMNICGGITEHHHHQVVEPLSPTSAAELAIANRKFAKTCVEKKRRDRINKCLDELKEIMSQTDDKARYQKMEKAEILEMAVNYMRMSMSGGGKINQTPSNDVYTLAYNQLLADFTHSLATMPGLRDDFKAQVLNQMGAQILRNKMAAAIQQQKQQQTNPSAVQAQAPPPLPPPAQHTQKRRRPAAESSTSIANKKYCVDTTPTGSAQQYFMYSSKYSGSCSSLDTNVHVPVSPCGSTSSSSCSVGGGSGCDAQALNLSSSSTHSSSSSSSSSSPPVSACSSPNSSSSMKSSSCQTSNSSSTSSSECFNKIFRPYL